MLGEAAAPADVNDLRAKLGLDRPLSVQYVDYLRRLAHGDLGQSFRYGTPAASEIAASLPHTILLAVSAMLVALLIAIPLGVVAAVSRGRWPDHAALTLSLVGVSMPNFWLGPLLALVFAVEWAWLPVSGRWHVGASGVAVRDVGGRARGHPRAHDARRACSVNCTSSTCWRRARAVSKHEPLSRTLCATA